MPETPPENPPPFRPHPVTRSERLYDSKWCGLRRDWLELPDGSEQEYHVVEIPDAVVVVPVTREGTIVLVGQYRHPNGKTHWEVPAGRIVDGELPASAALRELREETGFRAARLSSLPGFFAANGITAHFAHVFVAHDCERDGDPDPDPSEQIVVRPFARAEVESLLDAGRFEDGFSALALLYWLRSCRG